MTLEEILKNQDLNSALIIDDGYDLVPRAQDLGADAGAWATFVDDVGEDRPTIIELFPAFEDLDAQALQQSDTFVEVMWNAKGRIKLELWNSLFLSFEQASAADRAFLDQLEAALKTFGITATKVGREITDEGRTADFVFADLFLGATQQDADIESSLRRLKPVLDGREDSPPLVVLMSQSSRLNEKKAEFRDRAQLLGTMFRVYRKRDLLEGTNLELTLQRLATHRPDALRVAKFLNCWKKGLEAASDRFLTGVRRLDLSDYGQITDVLLTFEGQPIGSYLLDVYDKVYQHEIEGDSDTIAAAGELNNIDTSVYPAPHIPGSTDLQDLVYRSIWQNPRRLAVKTTVASIPVGFGDVLVKRPVLAGAAGADNGNPDAFLVVTPLCDLARADSAKRVMLLAGSVKDISPKTWTYRGSGLKTPIAVLPNDRRVCFDWDVKDIRTLTHDEIRALIREEGEFQVVLRLREGHALEIQQKMLADMGRVGLIAQMPATFPVTVSAFYLAADNNHRQYALPKASAEGAICYVGRNDKGDENTKVVFTEPVIDELLLAISKLDPAETHPKARASLERLKAPSSLASDLQKGLSAPKIDKTGFQVIKAVTTSQDGPKPVEVGLIGWNPVNMNVDQKNAALIIVLRDNEEVFITVGGGELSLSPEMPAVDNAGVAEAL